MSLNHCQFIQKLMLTVATLAAATTTYAQDIGNFPSKTITLVVPYAAGGSSDTRARQIASKMGQILGKSVIVENKPGAAGNIGTDYIAKANPDGHVIGIGNLAPLAVNKAMFSKLPFDPATDITPIGLIEKGPRCCSSAARNRTSNRCLTCWLGARQSRKTQLRICRCRRCFPSGR